MTESEDLRQYYPATARNRESIAKVLQRVLPPSGLILEIASGSGEHTAHLAPLFPNLVWQPSDRDPALLDSIAAHATASAAANIQQPLVLDVAAQPWPIDEAAAILCINMIHIAPWPAGRLLLKGAGALLAEGGVLYLYGPYKRRGRHTAPTNAAFDASLRQQNPAWGLRGVEEVETEARQYGLQLEEIVDMPANNFSLIFRKNA
jgi:SAM-dependent methyltransferase